MESQRQQAVEVMGNSEIEKMGISLIAMNKDLNGVVMLDGQKIQS
jgi:hypothetical protein